LFFRSHYTTVKLKVNLVITKIFICVYTRWMQSTRQRILDALEQRGSATARQLSQAFGMTPANLRRHLGILLARRLIQSVGSATAAGRGRPEQRYALSGNAKESNLEGLADALLAGNGKDDERMKTLAIQMLGNAAKPVGQATQRFVAAVQQLKPLGYKPSWEARPQGPQMVLGNCPYAAIIADHPELCRMDAYILTDLIGQDVEQVTKLQPGPQGVPQCVFRLQSKITSP
jgi:predicted ArsR family transcriptional regulator